MGKKRRYSERARRNSRNGINMRIQIMEDRLLELNREVHTYKHYLNRGLNDKWIRHVIVTVQRKIRVRQAQLKRYTNRRARLRREGKI